MNNSLFSRSKLACAAACFTFLPILSFDPSSVKFIIYKTPENPISHVQADTYDGVPAFIMQAAAYCRSDKQMGTLKCVKKGLNYTASFTSHDGIRKDLNHYAPQDYFNILLRTKNDPTDIRIDLLCD